MPRLCIIILLKVLLPTEAVFSAGIDVADSTLSQYSRPQTGLFLIADPNMPDPRFQETVILLTAHSELGSQGLIINRKTKAQLSELLDDVKGVETHTVYLGGPVGLNMVLFLVRHEEALEPAKQILENVYLSGARGLLDDMLASKSEQELRVYIGYSGWGPGQLESEMERGDWHLLAAKPELVFSTDPDSVWPALNQQKPGIMVQKTTTERPQFAIIPAQTIFQ